MNSKKLVKPILLVSAIIMVAILGTLGVIKLTTSKKTSSKDNSLKLASNTIYTSTLSKTVGGVSYTLLVDVKTSISSNYSSSYYNYYAQISINNNLLNYTWLLYDYYNAGYNRISSATINLSVVNGTSDNKKYYVLQVKPYSYYNSSVNPTYTVFDSSYKFVYQIPFPQWQTLSYNGTNYTSSNGVTIGTNYIYYYALPTSSTYAGQVEKHKVTFNNSAVTDTVIERKTGTVIVG